MDKALAKMPHVLETQPERDNSPEADANVGGDSAVDSDTASVASTLKGVVDADVAEDLVQRLLGNLPEPELSPLCKNEAQFSNYVGERVKAFNSDIVKPLVSMLNDEFGSQMNKDRLKNHLNGYANMLEEVLFGDKETDKPPSEGNSAKPANHVLAKFIRAGTPRPEGKSGKVLQKAWLESSDIFADDIKEEIRKTMPSAKKSAWKSLRPKLDNIGSTELGDHLVRCLNEALADAQPELVAAEAYKKQKKGYRESLSLQCSAARPQSTGLDKMRLADRPAWMRDEARRHLDAGGRFGQYSAACGDVDL